MAFTDNLTSEGQAFFDELKKLTELEVRIGYQHGKATNDEGVDLCDIAMFNELGTVHSPPRPFLRQSVDDNQAEIEGFMKESVDLMQDGMSAQTCLEQLGLFQKDLVQDKIVTGNFVANAESTIRKKGSSRPLIDTGIMRRSVLSVVKKKGEQ